MAEYMRQGRQPLRIDPVLPNAVRSANSSDSDGGDMRSSLSMGVCSSVLAMVLLGQAGCGEAAQPSEPGGQGDPAGASGVFLDCPDGSKLELPDGECAWAVCGSDNVVSNGTPLGGIGAHTGICTKGTPGFVILDPNDTTIPALTPPVVQLVARLPNPDAIGQDGGVTCVDPNLCTMGEYFNSSGLQLLIGFPDVSAVAPVKFTHDDMIADCAEGGAMALPNPGFHFRPKLFCEDCADIALLLACSSSFSCGSCGAPNDEFTFEISTVDYDGDGTPIRLVGTMEGNNSIPGAGVEFAYRVHFDVNTE